MAKIIARYFHGYLLTPRPSGDMTILPPPMSAAASQGLRRCVLAALVMSLLSGCAVTPARQRETSAPGRARQEVQARLAQIFDAAEKKDFRRLDSYHLYGPRFSKFSGPTFARQDAVAARSGEHTGLGAINELRMHAADLKIDIFADTAVATFLLEYSFRAGAATIRKKERATLVFVKRRGEWLITHEHLSAPAPPSKHG